MIRTLLHPEDPIIMGIGSYQVRQPIFVDIQDIDKAGCPKIELGMHNPPAASRISRSFQPALRRYNIIPPVAIHVTSPDAVSVAFRADNMFDKGASGGLIPGRR